MEKHYETQHVKEINNAFWEWIVMSLLIIFSEDLVLWLSLIQAVSKKSLTVDPITWTTRRYNEKSSIAAVVSVVNIRYWMAWQT